MKTTLWLVAVVSMATAASIARAASDSDAGEVIVKGTCATCHPSDVTPRPPNGPPSFRDIVRGHKFDRNGLRAYLHQPHYPMPPRALTSTDIESLVAYFDSQGYWP